jgi:hypothetical protein
MPNDDPISFLSEEKIRSRALELYAERGQKEGRDQDDWFKAEKELIDSYLESCFEALAQKRSA